MIGILGGMGTQAGLDFCNKLAMLIEVKLIKNILFSFYIINQIYLEDQSQLAFILKDSSDIWKPKNLLKYNKVLKSLIAGC